MSCFVINAQYTEKLIKKLPDGKEVYQRKSEVVSSFDQPKVLDTFPPDKPDSEKGQLITWKIEAVLKNSKSNQERIIWTKEISFDKRFFAFTRLNISDVYIKGNNIYLLYFEGVELRVVKLVKEFNGWNSKDDTYTKTI